MTNFAVRYKITPPTSGDLFARVASILEQARGNVVRSVNANMVLAYWLICREIVLEIQRGEDRAEYGKQIIENLYSRLTDKYGRGFSAPTLWNFRQFYQVHADRFGILSPSGRESTLTEDNLLLDDDTPWEFSRLLSWSHYRALMRVQDDRARLFYEQETISTLLCS